MIGSSATAPPSAGTLDILLRRYADAGDPMSCEPVAQGLLNRGFRLATTRGRYFLKLYVDSATADSTVIARQHRATQRLDEVGLPVAPPLPDTDGRTVAVLGGRCYALYPWVDGRHRDGGELTTADSRRLGALLGLVHTTLARVQPAPEPGRHASADPELTYALIAALLRRVRARAPRETFDELAEHRLLERRTLLERHAHRRPPDAAEPVSGWVHGDFHPLNLLYREDEPVAIVDWDRLGVQPRAEEAVRAAVIFFVRPGGTLDLEKIRAYARAYRAAASLPEDELAAAVHRVWWERLNDFWMLRWRYVLDDRRTDPLFPASSALVVWWTAAYEAVLDAFTA
ncbi:phosphotransferase [Streptomyces sp. NPDC001070]